MHVCSVRDQEPSRFMGQQIENIWAHGVSKISLVTALYVAKDTSGGKADRALKFYQIAPKERL